MEAVRDSDQWHVIPRVILGKYTSRGCICCREADSLTFVNDGVVHPWPTPRPLVAGGDDMSRIRSGGGGGGGGEGLWGISHAEMKI